MAELCSVCHQVNAKAHGQLASQLTQRLHTDIGRITRVISYCDSVLITALYSTAILTETSAHQ